MSITKPFNLFFAFLFTVFITAGHPVIDVTAQAANSLGVRPALRSLRYDQPPTQYSPSDSLLMAPKYAWHTFYGGYDWDGANALAVDNDGNVYMAGYSRFLWQGDGKINPLHPHSGGSADMVIVKLDSVGTYQWHTFYGGAAKARAMAVDDSGNVYIAGESYNTWQGDGNIDSLHSHSGGTADIVVLKLNSAGNYQWHTFYGASNDWNGVTAMTLDASGNVYVSGYNVYTWQGDNAANPLHPHSSNSFHEDMVILKLDSAGSYQWHTFYGAPYYSDMGRALAADNDGNVYVAGQSALTWQGSENGNPLHPHNGGMNMVIVKLSGAGDYQWHTFYGGVDSWNVATALAVDGSGNVYAAGHSDVTWQGDGNTNPLHPYSGSGIDMGVVKLNNTGNYQWHTFYGGNDYDYPYALALDSNGDIYIAGVSYATWSGEGGGPLHPHSSSGSLGDMVIAKLSSAGNYRWHTFYGGSDYDEARALTVDTNGNIYVAGDSRAPWQGDNNAAPLHPYCVSGIEFDYDTAILKLARPLSYSERIFLPIIIK